MVDSINTYNPGDWVIAKCTLSDTRYIGKYEKKEASGGYYILRDWSWVGCPTHSFNNVGGFNKILRHANISEIHEVLDAIGRDKFKEYLEQEAKKKYKVGDVVNQRDAYDGLGGKFEIKNTNIMITSDGSGVNVAIGGFGVFNTAHGKWASVVSRDSVFTLPKKWCIKADGEGDAGKYFNKQYGGNCYTGITWGYLHNLNNRLEDVTKSNGRLAASFHESYVRTGYTEITPDQFREHVLGEVTEKEITEGILEEAKRRYPPRTKYIDPDFSAKREVKGVLRECHISSGVMITDGHGGAVYEGGKWAEIVKLPKKEVEKKYTINETCAFFKDYFLRFNDKEMTEKACLQFREFINEKT